ncbi:MAG: phospho-N-acetylmuramoyl-pentapeptide-transferase [Desulfobacteraceae bacterium 4572_130]|nr:MAG: phospho-N-acetylmuramoyl-pentapeptide-transferase [Desulfobacteraceae bacterium 4572_130]
MLYHLLYPLYTEISFFNIFRYITFRAIYASITAFLICFIMGPWVIKRLSKMQIGQFIQDDGPITHHIKKGTPTMGGILILFSLVISIFLWTDLLNHYVSIIFVCILLFGSIGFIDDYLTQIKKNNKGLSAKIKFLIQIIAGLCISSLIYIAPDFDPVLTIPFFKNITLDLGIGYVLFSTFVIVATSNAVNLTDGLDGLAIGPIIIAGVAYMFFAYLAGHITMADYLQIKYIASCGEIAIVCAVLAGAGIGFLWFNAYPAQIFMGDTGSIPLGAIIGTIAVITKQEILLIGVGGVFVLETLSVIIQVAYYKITNGKRAFRMAPLHHHFELKGWHESKVIIRFWIISIAFALISLSTLKIR